MIAHIHLYTFSGTNNQPTFNSSSIIPDRAMTRVSADILSWDAVLEKGGKESPFFAYKAMPSMRTCCEYTDLHTSKHLSTNVWIQIVCDNVCARSIVHLVCLCIRLYLFAFTERSLNAAYSRPVSHECVTVNHP